MSARKNRVARSVETVGGGHCSEDAGNTNSTDTEEGVRNNEEISEQCELERWISLKIDRRVMRG